MLWLSTCAWLIVTLIAPIPTRIYPLDFQATKNLKTTGQQEVQEEIDSLVEGVLKTGKGESNKAGNGLTKLREQEHSWGRIVRLQQHFKNIPIHGFELVYHEYLEQQKMVGQSQVKKDKPRKLIKKKETMTKKELELDISDPLEEDGADSSVDGQLIETNDKYISGSFMVGLNDWARSYEADTGESIDQTIGQAVEKENDAWAIGLKKSELYKGESRGMYEGDSANTIVYVDREQGRIDIAYKLEIAEEFDLIKMIIKPDGRVIKEWNAAPRANSQIREKQMPFGRVTWNMDTKKCRLETKEILTMDYRVYRKNGRDLIAHEFDFCTNDVDDSANGAPSPLNDAHHNGVRTAQMFREWYGTWPLPDGRQNNILVHVYKQPDEAMQHANGYYTFLGDGDEEFVHPLTSLDILSHEIGHGVTVASSGLEYEGDTGGLNEAFSDMTAKAVEEFHGVRTDWKIGNIHKSVSLRCMDNPPCDKHSIMNVAKMKRKKDPHHSSGIFNFVFYVTAENFGVHFAYDLFYYANTNHWRSVMTFEEAAAYTLLTFEEMRAGKFPAKSNFADVHKRYLVRIFAKVGIECERVNKEWKCNRA